MMLKTAVSTSELDTMGSLIRVATFHSDAPLPGRSRALTTTCSCVATMRALC